MPIVDLNSDLGESFGEWTIGDDGAMLPLVTSANLACGFHGGDPATMLAAATLAVRHGVVIGAHPSYRDLVGFGRRDMEVTAEQLHADLLYQVGALQLIAHQAGGSVDYIKLHGALYNRAASDPTVADVVAETARALELPLLGLPESELDHASRRAGVHFVREAFADRGYLADGTLAPRSLDGALLTDPEVIAARVVDLVTTGDVQAIDGSTVTLHADSICVHGDTPGAVAIARAVRSALQNAGVQLKAFAPTLTRGAIDS